jgi:hypothetical protein
MLLDLLLEIPERQETREIQEMDGMRETYGTQENATTAEEHRLLSPPISIATFQAKSQTSKSSRSIP